MANISINTGGTKAKKRGKIRTQGMSFLVPRTFAALVDQAAFEYADGNASKYMRQAVLDRMIVDGIMVSAGDIGL